MKIESNNLDILMKNIEVGECFIFKDKLHMKIDNGCIEADNPNLVIDYLELSFCSVSAFCAVSAVRVIKN